jgi:23S rRNA (uracil1939-C5)-methyltransferase
VSAPSPAPAASPPAPLLLPRGPRFGDELEVTIGGLDQQGYGVALVAALIGPEALPRRYTVRVRKALPGDRVRVALEAGHKRVFVARVLADLALALPRVAPRCPHFGRREESGRGCGGCTLLALAYQTQLELKRARVVALLTGAGVAAERVEAVRPAPAAWRYRNKMEFSFGDDGARRFALGLHPTGFKHDVLRLEACHLVSEDAMALVHAVRAWAEGLGLEAFKATRGGGVGWLRQLTIREAARTADRLVELVTTHDEQAATAAGPRAVAGLVEAFRAVVAASGHATTVYWTQHRAVRGERTELLERHLDGPPLMREALRLPGGRELSFEIHPRAFFQPNTLAAEALCAEVIDAAGLGPDRRAGAVVDLYCGTGTLGLSLAPFAERVVGVELVADAVANARANAAANGVDNVTWLVGDAAEIVASEAFAEALGGDADVVVVDPPRAGLTGRAVEHVLAIGAPVLVYVSCNPESLARDLPLLADAGYALERARPVDLFPQTHHVETVARLLRR